MKTIYTAHASATGGRDGHGSTSGGEIDVVLSTPRELGGNGGPGTNPEQLFATGYSACFLGALKFVAGREKIKVPEEAKVSAAVGIGPRDDGMGFGIAVELTIHVPGLEHETLADLVKKADIVCPYSHSIRGNVDVILLVA